MDWLNGMWMPKRLRCCSAGYGLLAGFFLLSTAEAVISRLPWLEYRKMSCRPILSILTRPLSAQLSCPWFNSSLNLALVP